MTVCHNSYTKPQYEISTEIMETCLKATAIISVILLADCGVCASFAPEAHDESKTRLVQPAMYVPPLQRPTSHTVMLQPEIRPFRIEKL